MSPDSEAVCPLCGSVVHECHQTEQHMNEYSCPVCGRFSIPWEHSVSLFDDPRFLQGQKKRVSVVIREWNTHEETRSSMLSVWLEPPTVELPPDYVWRTFEDLVDGFPKRFSDRCDKALGNLAALSGFLGDFLLLDQGKDYPVVFGLIPDELESMVRVLEEKGYVRAADICDAQRVCLESAGWDRVADLEDQGRLAGCKQAFIAMSFHPDLNEVWESGLQQGVNEAGFAPVRIDMEEHNDYIPDKIIAEIRRSRFLVADVTGQKHGVYFEAGFALGLGIPVIWTCRKDEIDDCHFDTKQISHILWETPEELKEKLVNRIRATIF